MKKVEALGTRLSLCDPADGVSVSLWLAWQPIARSPRVSQRFPSFADLAHVPAPRGEDYCERLRSGGTKSSDERCQARPSEVSFDSLEVQVAANIHGRWCLSRCGGVVRRKHMAQGRALPRQLARRPIHVHARTRPHHAWQRQCPSVRGVVSSRRPIAAAFRRAIRDSAHPRTHPMADPRRSRSQSVAPARMHHQHDAPILLGRGRCVCVCTDRLPALCL